MGLLDIILKKKSIQVKEDVNKIGGNIAYYGLIDWWLNDFSEEERSIIRGQYKPLIISSKGNNENYSIDKGIPKPAFGSPTKFEFLNGLCYCFAYNHEIVEKIFSKSEECKPLDYIKTLSILDEHFYYANKIKFHYANREYKNHLDIAIEYCKNQINISKKVKQAWFKEYPNDKQLPAHTGFKQLAIIYEKQKRYKEALDITRRSLSEGWNNDNEKRIDKLEKKINNLKE